MPQREARAVAQTTRLFAHLVGGERSERSMTVLDLLRTRGIMTTEELRAAFGHKNSSSVGRYARDLLEEGLVERELSCGSWHWSITEHGRTVA